MLANLAKDALESAAMNMYYGKCSASKSESWTLDFILNQLRYEEGVVLQTSQHQDHIYGELVLLTTWPRGREPIIPDYTLSYIEVFARAAVAVL